MCRTQIIFADFGTYAALGYSGESPFVIVPLEDDVEVDDSVQVKHIGYWTTQMLTEVINGDYDEEFNSYSHKERFYEWYEEHINEFL